MAESEVATSETDRVRWDPQKERKSTAARSRGRRVVLVSEIGFEFWSLIPTRA